MVNKSKKNNKYKWDKNKGYGTKDHLLAIKNYGITNFIGNHLIYILMSYNKHIISISSSKYILGDHINRTKKTKDHSVDMVFWILL